MENIIRKEWKYDSRYTEGETNEPLMAELLALYKEMGMKDNLVEHSPFRKYEYPWALKCIDGMSDKIEVLDAGCGSSPLLLYLKRKYGLDNVTGIDAQGMFDNPTYSFRPEWVEKFGINYVRANIINYRSKPYDVIFCISVIEHIFRPIDRLKALVNLWENLKYGGKLIVTLDDSEFLLMGFSLGLLEVADVIEAINIKNKVFGVCLEKGTFIRDGKLAEEGMTEYLQQNQGL